MTLIKAPKPKRQHGLETQRALLVAAGKVFSRTAYADARLKDISDEARISQGSLYFHFGNKNDVARAVLLEQHERTSRIINNVARSPGTGLERVIALFDDLAHLIAHDEIVQAGIRLSMQPSTGLETEIRSPYTEWVAAASIFLAEGTEDGSVDADLDIEASAELLNEIFVGAQTLACLEDQWASLPRRVASACVGIRAVVSSAGANNGATV